MQILANSSYDQMEVNLATRLIEKRRQYYKDGVIALDCGANIGVHTIEWAKNMTEWGEVFSFEPQEKIYYALSGNIAINNCFNVTAKNAALGSVIGKINIPKPNYNKPSSFGSLELKEKKNNEFIGQAIDYQNTKQIDMLSIDSLKLKRIDFIKIDVEGMEEEVLKGSTISICRFCPILLIEHIKSDINSLKNFLENKNYEIFLVGMNILAIHKEDPTLIDVNIKGGMLNII